MHKATFLEGTLKLAIQPDGPLLIKAGESGGADPTLPAMEFVRSQGRIYIPGASLKGVIRAQCERICRSMDSGDLQAQKHRRRRERFGSDEPLIPLADNPLGEGRTYNNLDDMAYSSGRAIEAMKLEGPERTAIVYRRSSFTSQMFGHTSLAGRMRFADAYLADEPTIEERNGVAIDRIYGSVAVGPFNYETVVAGTFATRIDFKNITLAQLGLLGLALRDLAEGRVAIGFAKSRGLGRVKVAFGQLNISYPSCELTADGALKRIGGAALPPGQLAGLGALCAEAGYALPPQDTAALPDGLGYTPDELIGVHLVAEGDAAVRAIWRACMPAWKAELGL
jgi:CRISPR/Cas system CSM-associated protein Csm3 (group 7 of RAMP superfamily)